MPPIVIRSAILEDIPKLMEFDHSYTTENVWQMDIQADDRTIGVNFRENRLPRTIKVEYPRNIRNLMKDWIHRDALIVALQENQPVGYISLSMDVAPASAWITDIAVKPNCRKQGIGSSLVLSALQWVSENQFRRIISEVQSKNIPAIRLYRKIGFEFCGYHDHFYANQDIALFFTKSVL